MVMIAATCNTLGKYYMLCLHDAVQNRKIRWRLISDY